IRDYKVTGVQTLCSSDLVEACYQQLWDFVDGLIGERGPGGGRDDLLDDLISANTAGRLSDVELRQMLIFLFGAGYDTSKNQLTRSEERRVGKESRCGGWK